MKKAFSMSEFAVVLVIIGIIILLTLKVRRYTEISRWQNNVGIIKSAMEAPRIYFDITSPLFGKDISRQEVERVTGIKLSSVRLDYFGSQSEAPFTYSYATLTSVLAIDTYEWYPLYVASGTSSPDTMLVMSLYMTSPYGLSQYMICNLEDYLDDKQIYSGLGRMFITDSGQARNYTDSGFRFMDFDRCNSLSTSVNRDKIWAMKIQL